MPFAPHAAEEILLASGRADAAELSGRWPAEADIPVAPEGTPTPWAQLKGEDGPLSKTP